MFGLYVSDVVEWASEEERKESLTRGQWRLVMLPFMPKLSEEICNVHGL